MKYTVKYSTLFKKSYRKCMKRGCDEELFRTAITILAETGSLPKEYKLILLLVDTGTHQDIFGW